MIRRAAWLLLAAALLGGLWLWTWFGDAGGPPRDLPLPPQAAPADGLRIVAFGTSLTTRANWPDDVLARLRACAGPAIVMIRHARPGAGSDWALTQAATVAGHDPDLVIIEFAINDADRLDGVSVEQSQRQHLDLIRALRERAPRAAILLLTTNPVARRARLKRPTLRQYYDTYPMIADRTGAGVVDGYRRWLAVSGWSKDVPDGVHPLPAAESAVLAGPLADAIAAGFSLSCPAAASP
jgi:acyl-CoA thioesterase I